MIVLLVGLAGGLGAMARFSLDSWITARWQAQIPVGTVVINVTGSLLMGLLVGWALRSDGGAVLAVLGTGAPPVSKRRGWHAVAAVSQRCSTHC